MFCFATLSYWTILNLFLCSLDVHQIEKAIFDLCSGNIFLFLQQVEILRSNEFFVHRYHFQAERALFLESNRSSFIWIDEWYEMTMQHIRELEQESDSLLNEVRWFLTLLDYLCITSNRC